MAFASFLFVLFSLLKVVNTSLCVVSLCVAQSYQRAILSLHDATHVPFFAPLFCEYFYAMQEVNKGLSIPFSLFMSTI